MSKEQQKEISKKIGKKIDGLKIVVAILVFLNVFLGYRIISLESKYTEITNEVKVSRIANEQVLTMLKEVRDKQEKQSEDIKQAMNVAHRKKISKQNVIQLKSSGMNIYTDLGYCSELSVDEINKIIDYYEKHASHGTAFVGHGEAFIKAAEITGLNPIYIFAHAACESDFGQSYYGQVHHNYFGINAVDSNPDLAYVMGDDVDAGIIAGAMWIKENYYDDGLTNLKSMHDAGYASAGDWAYQISDVANSAIQIL